MAFEQDQVSLRLITKQFEYVAPGGDTVRGDAILKQLDKNKQWQNDREGKFVAILFDGRPFQFRDGRVVTVGKTVADALQRSGRIIVGAAINGPSCPFLEVVKEFKMGDQTEIPPKTACPICGEDQHTFPRLARHMEKEKKSHPELFKDDTWEEPVETKPVTVPPDEDEV